MKPFSNCPDTKHLASFCANLFGKWFDDALASQASFFAHDKALNFSDLSTLIPFAPKCHCKRD
jgi:hypothetical protein